MIHQVIHVYHSTMELIVFFCFYMMILYSSIYSISKDLIKQHLSVFFKFILSKRLSNSLWGSDTLLLAEFMNTLSILYYNLIILCIIMYLFSNFFLFDTKTMWFFRFQLVSFRMYYLLFFVQELLAIFEAFV